VDANIAPGTLLVATPGVVDGVFDQAVVLLLDHDDTSGSVGVVLNQLSRYQLATALPQWARLVCAPHKLFNGGPVSQTGAVCLASPVDPQEDPPGWRRVFEAVGLLNLDTPVEIADGAYASLRVFAGYAGWSVGQLAQELRQGMWLTVSAEASDPFDPDPKTLWARVLRRQGGDLALYSTWSPASRLN
jgi:putative transcriptional regulator